MNMKSYMHSIFSILNIFCINNFVIGFHYDFVTCGSTLKLLNNYHNVRLHSHDVKYGSGSGQQSVTAVESSDDNNSYWQVKAKTNAQCIRGIGYNSRLTTSFACKAHLFPYAGDNWVVLCGGKYWSREDKVRLKNVVTEYYLHVSGDTFGRPISGQREVSAYSSPNELNYWQAMEGIYITPSEEPKGTYRSDTPVPHSVHTEIHDEF